MDELMEDSGELIFTAIEIDLDYEFDAARYFDFTKISDETFHSDIWFESAGSYSPSPFVTKLILREDNLLQQMDIPPRSNGDENMSLEGNESNEPEIKDCKVIKGENLNNLKGVKVQHLPTGLTFPNQLTKDKSKSIAKPSFPRVSTLMKPTASQLAKQNRPNQIGDPRFSKFVNKDSQKPGVNPFGIEVQAAKRQKLERGLLLKDGGTKQQNVLIHKVTTKKEEMIIENSTPAKIKITIPREPELATTQRAHRRMPKDAPQPDCAAPNLRRFKARPLNKKILEAPSLLLPKRSTPRLPEFQEFHLTNSNRALKHSSATSSSPFLVHEGPSDKMLNRPNVRLVEERTSRGSRRPSTMDVSRLEGHDTIHNFKARPLNMKIFSSKGDIGVSRNIKKETTVPMEFNFHTDKRRIQQNSSAVVDLFNKLCLNEVQPNTQSQLTLPKSSCFLQSKAAKENRQVSFQQHD